MVFSKLGATQGFEHGWLDGRSNKPLTPRPDKTLALLGTDYLNSYDMAYLDGYETGEQEFLRSESLKMSRQKINEKSQANLDREI
jgi:hypothetical protein